MRRCTWCTAPATQALNPALSELPVELYEQQAQEAAQNAEDAATDATTSKNAAAGSASAAASKANGTMWMDKLGNAYWGGSLSAGVLRNAAQSSTVSGTASVDNGPLGSNGNAKTVSFGMTYELSQLASGSNPGSGSVTGTIILERSMNSGSSWTQVSSTSISGTKTSTNEGGGQYHLFISAGASATYTDNTPGTGPFMYRARITSNTNFPATWGGNPGSQRTYVGSTES